MQFKYIERLMLPPSYLFSITYLHLIGNIEIKLTTAILFPSISFDASHSAKQSGVCDFPAALLNLTRLPPSLQLVDQHILILEYLLKILHFRTSIELVSH